MSPWFLSNGLGRKFPGPGIERSRGKTGRRRDAKKTESEIIRVKIHHVNRLPGKPPLLALIPQ